MQTCFECGALADHEHHVIPHSKGGTKTVPLCLACHSRVHGHDLCGRKLTQDALAAKKVRGERTGSVPYGYSLAPDGVRLLSIPEEQKVIAKARRLHGTGQSLRAIARELESQGFVSRASKIFDATQVRRMVAA